jgi:hypothetical protein
MQRALPPPTPLEGDYRVIPPNPRVVWSFWRDDLPALTRLIAGAFLAAAVYRFLS